jgi:hypothetical protein
VRRLDLGEHGFMVSRSGGRLMLRLRGFVDMLGVERLPLLAHVPHSCDCRCFGLEDAGSQARSPGMRPARPDALGSGPSDGPQVRISPGIVSGVGSSRASPSCHWHLLMRRDAGKPRCFGGKPYAAIQDIKQSVTGPLLLAGR